MRKVILTGVMCAVALSLFGGMLSAAPFEPLFQLHSLDGKVMVQTPGTGKLVKAEENRAYPYGTRVQTDKRGSVIIILSEDNTVTLAASTIVELNEDAADKSKKILVVDSGSVDVKLDTEFHQSNGFDVVTPVASCKAIGCTFNVFTKSETEVDVTTFTVSEGKVSASGPDFDIPGMDDNDELVVTTAKDDSFSRIETVKGEIEVLVRDAEGTPKSVQTSEGSLIKIWRRTSETGTKRIVTVLVTTPDGMLEEAITYTQAVAPAAAAAAATAAAAAPAPKPPAAPEAPAPAPEQEEEKEPEVAGGDKDLGDMPPAEENRTQLPAVGSPATLGIDTTPRRAAIAAGIVVAAPPSRPRPDPTKTGLR